MPEGNRVVELLEEILVWTRAGMYGQVKDLVLGEFGDHQDSKAEVILAYDLLNGTHTYKEITEICKRSIPGAKVSPSTISSWVSKWERLGLVKKEGSTPVHLFALSDFGLTIPSIKEPKAGAAKNVEAEEEE